MKRWFACFFFTVSLLYSQQNAALQRLGKEFFEWRSISQPVTGDDIPRIERPNGWIPDYSPNAVRTYKTKYTYFRSALRSIPAIDWTRADSIDYLLLRSAIERVNWELNILELPARHPEFYIQQTIGSLFDILVIGSPWTHSRAENFLLRLRSIPKSLADAKINLTRPVRPFALIAIGQLNGIGPKLRASAAALRRSYPELWDASFGTAVDSASDALEHYSQWLTGRLSSMDRSFSVGRKNFTYFLKNIALVPYSPEELLAMGRQEWERTLTFEAAELLKNKNIPATAIFGTVKEQIEQGMRDENAIRTFVSGKDILTVPGRTAHYTLKAIPEYVKSLEDFGELDDFTSPSRLQENAVRYIPDPSPDLPFFYRSAAADTRPLTIHEGVPGHYFQLVRSWQNPDPIRRHYFDSNSNEGIGFYLEEMLLQAGLMDDAPHTRETIYRFMRLRALRVEADVNLALGKYTIETASRYLVSAVPMDSASAVDGAAFYASTPGQAITYQIGKLQIMKLIGDARIQFGSTFDLRQYHDYMMINGNVPISLQRWEYTGRTDELKKLWDK